MKTLQQYLKELFERKTTMETENPEAYCPKCNHISRFNRQQGRGTNYYCSECSFVTDINYILRPDLQEEFRSLRVKWGVNK